MVTWGPEAAKLTEAERAEILADLHRQSDEWHTDYMRARHALEAIEGGTKCIAVPLDDMITIYECFREIIGYYRRYYNDKPIEEGRIPGVFGCADIGACHAGQWLPNDARKQAVTDAESYVEKNSG
jgi:hypothetical protein